MFPKYEKTFNNISIDLYLVSKDLSPNSFSNFSLILVDISMAESRNTEPPKPLKPHEACKIGCQLIKDIKNWG